jgi:hypothetical protein
MPLRLVLPVRYEHHLHTLKKVNLSPEHAVEACVSSEVRTSSLYTIKVKLSPENAVEACVSSEVRTSSTYTKKVKLSP